MGVLFHYLVGLSAFWTIEIRWVRRVFRGLSIFMSGQLLPIQLMPSSLQRALTWSPFQTLVNLPVSTWLGVSSPRAWWSAVVWLGILGGLAWKLTQMAQRRLEVQGG